MSRILAAIFLVGSCTEAEPLPCPALEDLRADDEVVAGITAQELVASTAGARGPVAVEWKAGGVTTARVRLLAELGTAHFRQRRDCVPECPVDFRLAMQCPPDALSVDLSGAIGTADGVLDREHFTGWAWGHRTDAGLEWSGYAEIPGDQINGSLDPLAESPRDDPSDPVVLVWLGGLDAELSTVDVGLQVAFSIGRHDAVSTSSLGNTPR